MGEHSYTHPNLELEKTQALTYILYKTVRTKEYQHNVSKRKTDNSHYDTGAGHIFLLYHSG